MNYFLREYNFDEDIINDKNELLMEKVFDN